jgi:predicted DCC family thiol-disulfide oxidoreductase YuxK
MLKKTGFDSSTVDSVLVWDQQSSPLVESAGVFRVLIMLGGFWRLFFIFKLVPLKFQNWIYRYIAKRRYRWFGKNKTCPIPEVDIRHKFL